MAVLVAVMSLSVSVGREPLDLELPALPMGLSDSSGTGITLAATDPRIPPPNAATSPRSFYDGYLRPDLEKYLSRVGALHTWTLDRPDVGIASDHDDLEVISERMFGKGASKAIRSYLSEVSGLETVALNVAGRNGLLRDPDKERRFRVRLGISSALPRLDLQYLLGKRGEIRFTVCGTGDLDLNYGYRSRSNITTRAYASWEHSDRQFDTGFRVRF